MQTVSIMEKAAWLTLDLFTAKDDDRPVYLTGNFNDWTPNDTRFQLEKLEYGRYRIQLKNPLVPKGEVLEYKYVKGNWSGEELNERGMPSSNRKMMLAKGTVTDVVEKWKENPGSYAPHFFPKIKIVSEQFEMPQLSTKRRISVLLPHNYDSDPNKYYPVIYLQDGQNLLDQSAPYGSWHLDDYLGKMAQGNKGDFIVVAIDHGGEDRIKEFMPHPHKASQEALGRQYASFLAETLKPYIDQNFRTLPDALNTGIGGSSMGGLISIYAGILFPHLFSKYMIFSPSLWASDKIFEESLEAEWLPNSRLYLFAGANEGFSVVPNLTKWGTDLSAERSDLVFDIKIDPEGTHSEAYWGRAFPAAMAFLFQDAIVGQSIEERTALEI